MNTAEVYTQPGIDSFFSDPTENGSFNAGSWKPALTMGTITTTENGQLLWVSGGLIGPSGKEFDAPLGVPTLNASGAIEATVQVRKDVITNIDAILLKNGELAVVEDGGGIPQTLRAGDGVNLGGYPIAGNWGDTGNYLLVPVVADPEQNGINLLAYYALATALTPNGAALAADNRAVLFVPPEEYDLGTNGELELDTEFVDVVGLSSNREHQYIHALHNGVNTGVIHQTADDVLIANLDVKIFGDDSGPFDNTRPAAYFPSTNLTGAKVRNCRFRVDDGHLPMRGYIEYSGVFINCEGGNLSFGVNGTFSGTAIDCIGGTSSFATSGTFSGTARNCIGGFDSFACAGTFSGTAINCIGGGDAFGGLGTFSGMAINCRGEGGFGAASFSGTSRAYGCRLAWGTFPDVSGIAGAQIVLCIEETTGTVVTQVGT